MTQAQYKANGLIPELLDQPPKKPMKIEYGDGRILQKNTGVEYTPTQVRLQPNVSWPDMKDGRYYTIIMIDPDMPSRATPVAEKTQVLHWLMVNIPGRGVGGKHLAPYIGSGPPPKTGIHRYNFFVFDEGKTPKDYSCVKPMGLVDINRRVNWSFTQSGKGWTLRQYMDWAKLGQPIACNFYQAQYDAQVDRLWRTFDTFYDGSKNDSPAPAIESQPAPPPEPPKDASKNAEKEDVNENAAEDNVAAANDGDAA